MKSFDIIVNRTARVHMSGSEHPEVLWLCMHGYGELAADLYNKVNVLANEKTLVVCPEGLSRFYTRGGSGPVGASWMTKESRETEIKDYCEYLDKVVKEILREFKSIRTINVFGFSQGAATACRWFQQTNSTVFKLILWGAVFPPDVTIDLSKVKATKMLVVGDKDQYLKMEEVNKIRYLFDVVIQYEGTHAIDPEVLKRTFITP